VPLGKGEEVVSVGEREGELVSVVDVDSLGVSEEEGDDDADSEGDGDEEEEALGEVEGDAPVDGPKA
jgi:hypothetical protein